MMKSLATIATLAVLAVTGTLSARGQVGGEITERLIVHDRQITAGNAVLTLTLRFVSPKEVCAALLATVIMRRTTSGVDYLFTTGEQVIEFLEVRYDLKGDTSEGLVLLNSQGMEIPSVPTAICMMPERISFGFKERAVGRFFLRVKNSKRSFPDVPLQIQTKQ